MDNSNEPSIEVINYFLEKILERIKDGDTEAVKSNVEKIHTLVDAYVIYHLVRKSQNLAQKILTELNNHE